MDLSNYPCPGKIRHYEEVMPLVIRGNVVEKIVISFSHSLNRNLSIHVQGLDYDVQTSDGANV